jgi:hypothetical protein
LTGVRDVLLLENQPFNAQAGIIADVLCQFSDCRIQFERATVMRLIEYGVADILPMLHLLGDSLQYIAMPHSLQRVALTSHGPAKILKILQNNEAYNE